MKKATDKFNQNIAKRGQVTKTKDDKLGVGPIVLGILVFIVVGSGMCRYSPAANVFQLSVKSSEDIKYNKLLSASLRIATCHANFNSLRISFCGGAVHRNMRRFIERPAAQAHYWVLSHDFLTALCNNSGHPLFQFLNCRHPCPQTLCKFALRRPHQSGPASTKVGLPPHRSSL